MNCVPASPSNIQKAAEIIKKGGLVAFPTETVYGLGADALDPCAAARIFEVKNRPYFDPLIVHIADRSVLTGLCSSISALAEQLMEKFWPGPLTLVLSKTEAVPDIVTAGLSTVAVRMPNHSVALELIKQAGTPIAAPSANPFGYLSPTTAIDVVEQLGDRVDLILDAGKCSVGIESTILDLSGDAPILLRPGGVTIEAIERVVGAIVLSGNKRSSLPTSPGQLPRHYSPRTPIKILGDDPLERNKKRGLLAFRSPQGQASFQATEILSATGDVREAAANLFSCLHRLDKAGLDVIYAEPIPEFGLGRAIMDRLRRASNNDPERPASGGGEARS